MKDATANVAAGIVRPRLVSGDALIFDARILHFGLPNRSSKRRAIVYCNHTGTGSATRRTGTTACLFLALTKLVL